MLTTGLVACCYALAFGMLQHIPRLVPGLPQVAELPRKQQEQWVSWVHLHVDVGALIGRLLLTGLVVWFVSRRPMLRWMLWAGLALFPLVFLGPALGDASTFKYAALLVTLVVGVQYSFWGNYLPRVFPLHLRGTGESFAIELRRARAGAVHRAGHATALQRDARATPTLKLAHSMALVAVVATICALLLSRRLPEPSAELLDE